MADRIPRQDLTKNQAAVLDALKSASGALSAYAVLDHVKEQGLYAPQQVYRALDKLIALGMVHRVESKNRFVACCHGPHEDAVAFLICEHCDAVVELPVPQVKTVVGADADKAGFGINELHVEAIGSCKDCRSKVIPAG